MCKKMLSIGIVAVLVILIPIALLILDFIEEIKEEENRDS